jgi:hypothetical protein
VAGAVHRHCACGVIPVVRYFQTGEQALRTATSADFAASLDEILARFRLLAQHEAGTLCAACAHPGWEGCELRKSTFPA